MSRSVTLRVIMKIGVEIFIAVKKKLDLNFRDFAVILKCDFLSNNISEWPWRKIRILGKSVVSVIIDPLIPLYRIDIAYIYKILELYSSYTTAYCYCNSLKIYMQLVVIGKKCFTNKLWLSYLRSFQSENGLKNGSKRIPMWSKKFTK